MNYEEKTENAEQTDDEEETEDEIQEMPPWIKLSKEEFSVLKAKNVLDNVKILTKKLKSC